MEYNADIMKRILQSIETNMKFEKESTTNSQDWNMTYNVSYNELLEKVSGVKPEQIRYCLWGLKELGYVSFTRDTDKVKLTDSGFKFMLETRYSIKCSY